MMASLQAPPSDAWLPSWSPESLIGNSFVYLPAVKSNAEDELKFEYASMNVKLVEKMEQAGFVLVDDSIDPENNAYLEIMKEARQQQVPILTISDLKLANSALRDNPTKSREISNPKPAFKISETWIDKETFQLTFNEEIVEYLKTENIKHQKDDREILQHELLLRDPTVREIAKNSPWEKLKFLIVENPPRIRGTRWTLDDVLKDYIAEAWNQKGHDKWIWKWNETEFNDDYQGSDGDDFIPTDAVRVALCVFFHDNKTTVEQLVLEESLRSKIKEILEPSPVDEHMSIEARQASMTPEFRLQKYEDLKMSHAITTAGKVAREPCVELRFKVVPPQFTAVEVYEQDNYIECHSERKRNFLNNGFTKALFNEVAPIVIDNLEASTSSVALKHTELEMRRTDHDIEYYSMASVLLTHEFIRPTENFVNRVKEALAKDSLREKHVQLQMIWDKFGYIWSPELFLGVKRDYLEDYWQTNPAALKKFEPDNSEDPRAIAELQPEAYKAKVNAKSAITGDQIASTASDSNEPEPEPAWRDNISRNPDTWTIIKRNSIVPIYELLEPELRDAVKEVIASALATKREGRCISKNSMVTLKNCHTKLYLQWSRRYLVTKEGKGMIVNTSPIEPAVPVKKWIFAPIKDSKDPHIRYNDVIRICGEPSGKFDDGKPKLYLHGSLNRHAPVSRDGEEVSLQEYAESSSTPGDNWVIERMEDPSLHAGVNDFGVDLLKYDSTYVRRCDRVRLRLESSTSHYLASHDVSLRNIWVRKKSSDIIPRLFTGSKAQKSKEVLLLDLGCVDGKDEWEVDNLDTVTSLLGESNELVTTTTLNMTNATEDQPTVEPGLIHLDQKITDSVVEEEVVDDKKIWLESRPKSASVTDLLGNVCQGSPDIYASASKIDLEVTGDSTSVHSESINMLSQELSVCTNCGKSTPLWDRDPARLSLCNTCSLYLKLNGEPRPLTKKELLDSQGFADNENTAVNEEEDPFPQEDENTAVGENVNSQVTTFGEVEMLLLNTEYEANDVSEQQKGNPLVPKALFNLEGDLGESSTLKRTPVWLKQSQSLGPGISAIIPPSGGSTTTDTLPQSATSPTKSSLSPIVRRQVHIIDENTSRKDFTVDSVPPEVKEVEVEHQDVKTQISADNVEEQECSNCGTTSTPMWGKGPKGILLCNSCSLYFKLNGKRRPVSRRDIFDSDRRDVFDSDRRDVFDSDRRDVFDSGRRDVFDSDDSDANDTDYGADDEKEEALGKEVSEMAGASSKRGLSSIEYIPEIRNNMKAGDMDDEDVSGVDDGRIAIDIVERRLEHVYDAADWLEDRTTSLRILEEKSKNTKKIGFLGRFGDPRATLVRRGSDSDTAPVGRSSIDSSTALVGRRSVDSDETLVNTLRDSTFTLESISENASIMSEANTIHDEWKQEELFDIDINAPKIITPEQLKLALESVDEEVAPSNDILASEYDSTFEDYLEWQEAMFDVDVEASNIITVEQLAKALSQSQRLDSVDGDESYTNELFSQDRDDTPANEPRSTILAGAMSLTLPMRSGRKKQAWKPGTKSGGGESWIS